MRISQIRTYFLSRSPWVEDWDKTWDNCIWGDAEHEVGRVLVCWQSSLAAIEYAIDHGYDTLITHEPTFWGYSDQKEQRLDFMEQPDMYAVEPRKMQLLQTGKLHILRLHDSWDRFLTHGIPYAWARYLGLEGNPAIIGDRGYLLGFDVPQKPAAYYIQQIATRVKALGQSAVQVVGDDSRPVGRIGVGTGCVCHPNGFIQMGCDLGVTCDDGLWYWGPISCAKDMGYPLVRVNHCVSEEPGMQSLTNYLRDILGLEADYYYEGCMFRLVEG
nr:Nif3-like dinuclear metal center hexameric protein [bacterium]